MPSWIVPHYSESACPSLLTHPGSGFLRQAPRILLKGAFPPGWKLPAAFSVVPSRLVYLALISGERVLQCTTIRGVMALKQLKSADAMAADMKVFAARFRSSARR